MDIINAWMNVLNVIVCCSFMLNDKVHRVHAQLLSQSRLTLCEIDDNSGVTINQSKVSSLGRK